VFERQEVVWMVVCNVESVEIWCLDLELWLLNLKALDVDV
jgi:hypothetical protein